MTGTVKRALATSGLLPAVRRVRRGLWLATDATLRERARQYREEFPAFRRRYGAVLGHIRPGAGARTVLVAASRCPTIETELALITALQVAGCRPAVLLEDQWQMLRPYYELAGVEAIHLWSEYDEAGSVAVERSTAAFDRCRTMEEVSAIADGGIRIGLAAVSSALRRHRVGRLDPAAAPDRRLLAAGLAYSATVAAQAVALLDRVRPDLALFWDTEYSPTAELFDACTARGVDTIAYRTAHRTNGLIFKRYSTANRDDQVSSLSAATWARLRAAPWAASRAAELDRELAAGYAAGDWFKECWTQALARRVPAAEVRARLGLDPAKRTAVIFSHILWDAPLSWARPVFPTYEDWIVETVRAAGANNRVNWVLKVHPAHAGKAAREHYRGEPAELQALARRLGALPPNIVVLRPETDLDAPSVFAVMDVCLTVRGTVGIEAARLGVPVLTAAESRYSGRGFTIDSATPAEYLARLAAIEHFGPLPAAQRELAERFAWGMFVGRPLVFDSVTWDYGDMGARPRGEIHVRRPDDWATAADIAALARWFGASRDEDFLAGGPVAGSGWR